MSGTKRPLRHVLRENYNYLMYELRVNCYVDSLFQERVLTLEQRDLLLQRQDTESFLDILMNKPESSIQTFFDMVRTQTDKQPHIYEMLFPESDKERHTRELEQGETNDTARRVARI